MLNKSNVLKSTIFLCILMCNLSFDAHAENNAPDSTTVANELNALYNKTDGCTGDNPDYYCSGIILHAQDFSSDDTSPEPWYLPNYRDVGSFSYIRYDIVSHVGSPIFPVSPLTGYILTPLDELQNTSQYPYDVYCSYPVNALSHARLAHGCGDTHLKYALSEKIDYSTCASKNVFSIDDYMKKYSIDSNVLVNGTEETVTQFTGVSCSFSPDKAGFTLSMDLYKYLFRDNPEKGCETYKRADLNDYCVETNNELIISTWPKEKIDPTQVPIKAFFVVINYSDPLYPVEEPEDDQKALSSVFKVAANFSEATHQNRQIPVVIIDMTKIKNGSTDIFSAAPMLIHPLH